MDQSIIHCPHCGSSNSLPFEDDSEPAATSTFSVIMLAALFIFVVYFVFIVSFHLNYTALIILGIILVSWLMNRKELKKKKNITVLEPEQDFVCLSCHQNFTA